MAKKADSGRRMGKQCGYTKLADGRIEPAPAYQDRLDKTANERTGINDLMKLFSSHCADLLGEISRRQVAIWDDICDDYGIDRDANSVVYDGTYLTITPKAKPKPSPSTSTGCT